jgi:hypothetical protein
MTKSNETKPSRTNSTVDISKGVRTTLRHPSKISLENKENVKVLASNIDTLVLTFDIKWERELIFFETLKETKYTAQSLKKEYPILFFVDSEKGKYLFNLKDHGARGYEWILLNKEYSLLIGNWIEPKSMPSIVLTIRSETLWRKGPNNAIDFIINFIKNQGGEIQKTRVSRLDMCADILFPSSLWSIDILDFAVTRAVSDSDYDELTNSHRKHKKLTGIEIGKGSIKVRLYDKPIEIKQRSNKTWLYDIWNLKEVPENHKIIRVEFQLRREATKELGIDTINDLFRFVDNAWSYCTTNWLKFQDHPDKQSHQRKTLQWWKTIQDGFNDIPAGNPLIRCKASEVDKDKLSQQILGYLSSFAAIDLEAGLNIDEKDVNIQSAFNAFYMHLKNNSLDKIDFLERVKAKIAKFQRINENYIESQKKRKEFGFIPDIVA